MNCDVLRRVHIPLTQLNWATSRIQWSWVEWVRCDFTLTSGRVVVCLVAGWTLASSRQEVPAAVSLAQVARRSVRVWRPRVSDTDAVTLDDRRYLRPSRRLNERRQRLDHWWTRDVVDVHGQQRRACALVAEHKVHTATWRITLQRR